MCFPFRTKIAKILCLNWNILLGWHTRYWWHNDLLKSKKKYINSNKGKIDSIWFNAATSGMLWSSWHRQAVPSPEQRTSCEKQSVYKQQLESWNNYSSGFKYILFWLPRDQFCFLLQDLAVLISDLRCSFNLFYSKFCTTFSKSDLIFKK